MATSKELTVDLNDMEEESLWEMIEQHRNKIVRCLRSGRLTPYLRQANVLDHLDEEEVLHNPRLTNSGMKAGHLLDLLRRRGKNGAIAFLESLKLHQSEIYTWITGKEPSLDLKSFSGLIEIPKLTEFLVKAAESVQDELMEEKRQRTYLLRKCLKQKEKLAELQGLEAELHRLRREYGTYCHEVVKLKEEKYELSMRYANALQEKDLAMTRARELQDQMCCLKDSIHRLEMALYCEKKRTLRLNLQPKDNVLTDLKDENERLKLLSQNKDMESEKAQEEEENPTLNLKQTDGVEGKLKESTEAAEKLRMQHLEEKEGLLIEIQKMEVDCNIYKEKIAAFQNQVEELQKERDQAYSARDMAQEQSTQTRVEKDSLRRQVLELKGDIFELQHQLRKLQLSPQQVPNESLTSLEQVEVMTREKPKLIRMHAIYPRCGSNCSSISTGESWQELSNRTSSELEESYQASTAMLPCNSSFNSQSQEDFPDTGQFVRSYQTCFVPDLNYLPLEESQLEEGEFEILPGREFSSLGEMPLLSTGPICPCTPLPRRAARRNHSRDTIIAFQGDALLEQLNIIGGNETGIFIHQVTPGSAADEMSLVPGSQIMAADYEVMDPTHKFLLEDVTLEEAIWILRRVKGFCCLSIRYNNDRYKKLVADIEKGFVTSGDSFYIRVNLAMEKEDGLLPVQCGEILHITDTMYQGECQWRAQRVDPYNMRDMENGTIPNYYKAQQLLITVIQDMSLQMATSWKPVPAMQKLVRVVSTMRTKINPLWNSFDPGSFENDKSEGCRDISQQDKSCFTLMPYTKVIPHAPTTMRPVLFVPSVVGRILREKLSTSREFINCQSECLTEAEYHTRNRNGDIISVKMGEAYHCCLTRQTIHSAIEMSAHCLLDLSVSCVLSLHQIETYPIILHISINDKNSRRLKKYLHKLDVSEDFLLECSRREESLLDKLPCLCRTIPPESWHDMESLVGCVKMAVCDEQKRTVWIEQEP